MLLHLFDRFKPKTGTAYFQARLQMLLWSQLSAADIRGTLLVDRKLQPYHDYISAMDDDMIEIARDLSRKWGRGTRG